MTEQHFRSIDPTEMEDSVAAIREYGYQPEEFDFVESVEDIDPTEAAGLITMKARLTVPHSCQQT